jgi:hypothetical protein
MGRVAHAVARRGLLKRRQPDTFSGHTASVGNA